MERINWKMLIAIPLMTVCVSACGENAVQPNKKNPETVSASASDPACQTFSVCERQAIKGDAKSQYDLAAMFDEGRCVAKSRISAAYWFGNAAQKGYADAKSRRESILQALEKSAGAGDAGAQYDLGWMYYHGYGLRYDGTKAIDWFEKAARQGNVKAQYLLGEIHSEDRRFEQDTGKAKHWFEQAAEQGEAKAQNKLSTLYYKDKDYTKARYWAEKSAGQGNDEGQVLLGWFYEKGYSVPQDYAKAKELYEKAAIQGNQKGQDRLAVCYRLGRGVPKDLEKAQYWSDKAMLQGDCGAEGGCR